MTHTKRLVRQIAGLRNLTRLQRSLRLGLRVFWLGAGGVMLGWAINSIWGWLPNPMTWLLFGILMASFPLYSFLTLLRPRTKWVWTLDQRLGLKEQVSTAWEMAEKQNTGWLSALLIRDVNVLLPKVYTRIMKRGWFFETDLVCALIIILLGIILVTSTLLEPYSALMGDRPNVSMSLPAPPQPIKPIPPNQQPAGQLPDMQPEGRTPGLGGQGDELPSSIEPSGDGPVQQNQDTLLEPAIGEVGEVLRQLGADLRDQAGTYDLGEALENLELNRSADAFEDLGDQLAELTPGTLDNLAQALQDASQSLNQAGESALSEDMSAAADSVLEEYGAAAQALDQVASSLRELADEKGASGMAGAGPDQAGRTGTGSPEPLSRLSGESGDLELPLSDLSQSDILNPSSSGVAGDGSVGEQQDGVLQQGDEVIQIPLLPNYFLWKWRDVVSQYFQR